MNIFKTIMYNLGMVAILLTIFLIVLLTYWCVYPYSIMTFNKGNGTLIEHTVKSGGYIQVRQNVCKKLNYTAIISRQFIDGIVHQIPEVASNRPMGCFELIEYVYVPKALPSGMYRINTVITYKVNPIRKIEYTIVTDEFEIVNGKE